MMPAMSLDNLISLSAQALLLGGVGLLLPLLIRIPQTRGSLAYYQLLLLLCLTLPWIAPWSVPPVVVDVGEPLAAVAATGDNLLAAPAGPSLATIVWGGILLGFAARLVWLGVGLRRLRRYRQTSRAFDSLPSSVSEAVAVTGVRADVRISDELDGPVTFGVLRPVILLLRGFEALPAGEQLVVSCHELVHVRRHDWLVHVLEELATVLFWFHPMVWWITARIRLAREQVVDQQVVALTGARKQYVSALLSMSGAVQADLAPAPLFLRRGHLRRRIHTLLKEVPVSIQRLTLSYAAIAMVLAGAAWLAVNSFPLMAAPQPDAAAGVIVDAGGPLLHRNAVEYPATLAEKGIGGSVIVDVVPAADGSVADLRVVSGPAELRRPVLESVLSWHYDPEPGLPATIRVTATFQPAQRPAARSGNQDPPDAGRARGVLEAVDVSTLPAPLQDRMRQQLAQFIGQPYSGDLMSRLREAARQVDPHVGIGGRSDRTGKRTAILFLGTPVGPGRPAGPDLSNIFPKSGEKRIRVGGKVQKTRLVTQPKPMYPQEARTARLQGTVRLAALIGTDGRVKDLRLIAGHPNLVEPSVEAVKQWVYRPTLLNGRPVEVVTQVDVNYKLTN